MKKKILAVAMATTMVASVFTGCGKTDSGRKTSDVDVDSLKSNFNPGIEVTSDNVTLTVWESTSGPDEFIEKAGEYFHEIYPNITIKYVNVESTDANSKIALDGPAGTGADLFATAHNNSGVMARGGYIEPVPEGAVDFVKNNCTEAAFAGATLNSSDGSSTVYGYPVSTETYALFYNKDLISEEEIPKTMGDMVEYINNYDKSSGVEAFRLDAGNAYYSVMFTSSPDIKLYGPNGNDKTNTYMSSEESIAQVETDFVGLAKAIGVEAGEVDYATNDALFSAGSLAMDISGAWNIPAFEEAGINFGITTIPSLTGSDQPPTNFMGVRCMFVSAYSQHKNEAAAFAMFLMTDEMQQLRCELTATMPAKDGILDKVADEKTKELLAGIEAQLKYSYPMPSMPETSLFWSAFGTSYSNIWNGEIESVKAELEKANATASK